MKQLIKPLVITSFALILTGLVPSVPWYMAVIGVVVWITSMAAGAQILGSQDEDYLAQLELIRLEHLKAKELVTACSTQRQLSEEHANRASKALSDLRSERGLR